MKNIFNVILSIILLTVVLYSKENSTFENIVQAIKTNNIKKIKALAENNDDLNCTNGYKESLLHVAAREGRQNIVAYLAKKIDVNIKNRSNATALHQACIKGNYISAKALIDQGAKINISDDYGDTPIHNAALRGSFKTIKLLIKNGANTNAKNNLGETPLHNASRGGYTKIISYLLKHNSDKNAKNIENKTPLQIATQRNKKGAIKLLAEK
jgi:ankyrin repeat protein